MAPKPPAAALGWPLVLAAAFFFYTASLLISTPASVLAWALSTVTDSVLMLERPEGGLWRGRAAALLVTHVGVTHRFQEVGWDLLAARLFRGELAFALTLAGTNAKGTMTVALRPRSIRVSNSSLALSAAAAARFDPMFAFARPEGEIALRTDDFALSRDGASGRAVAEWNNAASALSVIKPLGTYQARINGIKSGAEFEVVTASGALLIEGRGAWSALGGLTFNGTARASPEHATELKDLLRLLGPDTGNGIHQLQQQTQTR